MNYPKLNHSQIEKIRKKFADDWEVRENKYLYKRVAFDDYNAGLRFMMFIEKPQIKLNHYADIGLFSNEMMLILYTRDAQGLTQLDFELAVYIDYALERMGAKLK